MKKNSIVIILGASEFPNSSFSGSQCFLNSADGFKDYVSSKLVVDSEIFVKDLFNEELSIDGTLEQIKEFIEGFEDEQIKRIENVIIYYVGHGAVTDSGRYYLATKNTKRTNEYFSSLPIDSIADLLKEYAGGLRKYVILDCCFAASAVASFQSESGQVFIKAAEEILPSSGTSLLCASSKWEPAKYEKDSDLTMFSESLMKVLENGSSSVDKSYLSFYDVAELIRTDLKKNKKQGFSNPEIHVPDQKDGDISKIELFPNVSYNGNYKKKESLYSLIESKYFDDSLFSIEKYSSEVAGDFSKLILSFLSPSSSEALFNSGVQLETKLIDFLCENIINSKSTFPILVDGYTGSGKSLLLSLVYLGLANSTSFKKKYCPIYINLHHYEYLVYESQNIKSSSEELLQNDIDSFLSADESQGKEIVLIVDGADEYIRPKVDLFNQVLENQRFRKKIIGIRRFRSERLKRNIPFPGEPEVSLSVSGVIREGNSEISDIVNHYCKTIKKYSRKTYNPQLKVRLMKLIEETGLFEVDLFSLRLLTEVVENPFQYPIDKKGPINFSSILDVYCKGKCDDLNINSVSEMAFNTFNLKARITSDEMNNSGWKLIGSHHSVRNYLIARHVVNILRRPNKEQTGSYNFVYPHEVNSYIKQVINIDAETQRNVFEGVECILNFKELPINTRTHLAYLLGRFTNSNVSQDSFEILEKIEESDSFQKIKTDFENYESFKADPFSVAPKDRPRLLYLRTIYISLIYLDQGKKSSYYSNKYIEFCLKNPYQENLNRGFHLEYYGDIPYHPGDSDNLQHEDKLRECDLTFNKLSSKLRLSLDKCSKQNSVNRYYPMFEVELFTLCSLAQHRSIRVENFLKESYRKILTDLLDKVFDQKMLDEESIFWDYLLFVKKIVCNPLHVNQGHLYNLIYGLKRRTRRGWEIKGKMEKFKVERVSSHVWGAEDIALFFLPESLKDKDYSKIEIIKMLHIHDSGEAFTSDLIRGEKKTEDEKEEQLWMSIISSVGMVEDFAEVTGIKDLYTKFLDKNHINTKYANDCDKLECLLQAINYFIKDEITEDVYKKFTVNLKKELRTDWGSRIERVFQTIRDGDYGQIENEFLKKHDPDLK